MTGLVCTLLALMLALAGAADEQSILNEHLTAYARLQEHERLMGSTTTTPTIKQRFSPYSRRLQDPEPRSESSRRNSTDAPDPRNWKPIYQKPVTLIGVTSSVNGEPLWLPSLGALGLGFDATKTDDVSSATGQIFDTSNADYIEADVCGQVFRIPTYATMLRQCAAEATTSFTDSERAYAVEVGAGAELALEFLMFTGKISLDLKMHTKSADKRLYGRHLNDMVLATAELSDVNRQPFSVAFERDLNRLPQTWEDKPLAFHRFVQRWGTHYIRRYKLGARLEVTTVTNNRYTHDGGSLSAEATINMDMVIFKLSGNMGIKMGLDLERDSKQTNADYKMIGGDPTLVTAAKLLPQMSPAELSQFPSQHQLMTQWYESALKEPSAFGFSYALIADLAPTETLRRALAFATTLYVANQRPEDVISVVPEEEYWNTFQNMPQDGCMAFQASVDGADSVQLVLAAAPGWTDKRFTFRASAEVATLHAGTEQVFSSNLAQLRLPGVAALFADYTVCYTPQKLSIGRNGVIIKQDDLSRWGWGINYFGFAGKGNKKAVYVAGMSTYGKEEVTFPAPAA